MGLKQSIPSSALRYGTFQGVFLPSLLTMLGIVLYLRLGWVLGQVGLTSTLLIVGSATSIILVTALSLSALATNQQLAAGGAYYITSRSLGLEAGAAIGLPLYFAQAVGIAFYIMGFVETFLPLLTQQQGFLDLLDLFHLSPIFSKALSLLTLLLLTLLTYRASGWVMRVQGLLFGLILASLAAIFSGHLPVAELVAPAIPFPPIERMPFFAVFAVFFPALTGIEGGLSMSGDLKNAAKSLPRGTLLALLVAVVIYVAIPLYLSKTVLQPYPAAGKTLLMHDPLLLTRIQLPGVLRFFPLVLWALWGASLSSALSGLMGAPRTLQALAKDRILPALLAHGSGAQQTPRLATLVTAFIAGIALWSGALNKIATLLSMFFLLSYALLNLAAALEGLLGSPAWRPRFRIPWGLSLLGALACLLVMFEIAPLATPLALGIAALVYGYTQRRSLQAHWGDVRSGVLMLAARSIIYQLQQRPSQAHNWRPNILVLSGAPTLRGHLIDTAHALSQEKGFLTVCAVIPPNTPYARIAAMEITMRDYLAKQKITALAKVVPSEQVLAGARTLITHYGLGPIAPNTILLGTAPDNPNHLGYAEFIQFVASTQRNIMILAEGQPPPDTALRIDIWWRGWTAYAAFKLAIAFLLTRSPAWSNATIVLKTIITPEADAEQTQQVMETFIQHTRLDAQAEVIVDAHDDPFAAIRKHSADAHLVMLGLRSPHKEEAAASYAAYYGRLQAGMKDMPPILYTLNTEQVEFRHIFD